MSDSTFGEVDDRSYFNPARKLERDRADGWTEKALAIQSRSSAILALQEYGENLTRRCLKNKEG